ncbi:uncharacterized protein LOC107045383 [Diachasma alloeum]|uniref:uncharacterized protein LOC107045383 n=1 Tax=Diachasma alloeum TaxID=454923 RepID=UPI0007383BC7|nr:uncharacterized protein LOC107045383 [Diachasma alloeum]
MDASAQSIDKDGTKWFVNSLGTPHYGDKWEAALGSANTHLNWVIGQTKMTYEDLTILLTQVETILNYWPLCNLPIIDVEFAVLTPRHFLMDSALTTVPEPSLGQLSICRLSRHQHIYQITAFTNYKMRYEDSL